MSRGNEPCALSVYNFFGMDFIRNIFALNREIIYFVYGLVFFVLGLAINLQIRHTSRLELAQHLKWLAAFGFAHGFHEWGDLFIPIQAEYLPPSALSLLQHVHLTLLALSFAFLFEFGLSLLRSFGNWHWLRLIVVGVILIWSFATWFPLHLWTGNSEAWHNTANVLARYFIGLPGAVFAAYALRKYSIQRIAPMNVPRIFNALRLTGVTLFLYGLAGGLIGPAVDFFPGNRLNDLMFTAWFILPPQLVRAAIGLMLAVTTIRALEIFDVETQRQIETMQKRQLLSSERERIARELHDGTIQKIYTAGLLIRSVRNRARAGSRQESRLATSLAVLDDAIGDLRRNLSELNAAVEAQEPLDAALQNLAADPRFGSLIHISLDVDLPEAAELPSERVTHVLAIVREALANTVRHTRARHVSIFARRVEERLHLAITDDGGGIPPHVEEGHGLRNMRDRASLLGGDLKIQNTGAGTRLILDVPWRVSS